MSNLAWALACWALTVVTIAICAAAETGGEVARDLVAPVRVMAGGETIDVEGFAAPVVGDFDGDGRIDLLVGQMGQGRLRIYRNTGTNARPKFDRFTWFRAGGRIACIPSGCQVGFSPQLVDFDGDGDTDILSGSLLGEIFVFRRGIDGRFAEPEVIENKHGEPQVRGGYRGGSAPFYNSTVFLHDWDGDGDGDLLVGRGTRLLIPNEGTYRHPVFGDPQLLQIDGKPISGGYIQPVVADWDGDGRDDLLTGSGNDIVWYRNTAEKGPTVLGPPKILVPANALKPYSSSRRQNEPVELPAAPAMATGICVADFNGDGRPDLLLGDNFGERVESPEPMERQLQKMALADAARDALSSGYQLMRVRPENETHQQRVERYHKAVDQWRDWQAATTASNEYDASRYVRHGSVWLYARVAAENDTP